MWSNSKSAEIALLVLSFATPVLAQGTNTWPDTCGPREMRFSVQRDWYLGRHFTPATPPGKATIYFIQSGALLVRVAIDGVWIGATKDDSYFAVSVDPGKHHICEDAGWIKLSDIDVEPGRTYYVRAQMQYFGRGLRRNEVTGMELETIDAHDGGRLIAKYPLSVFQEKKQKAKKNNR